MIKISDKTYVRCADELNFSICSPIGKNKKGDIVYHNDAYLNTVQYLNRYCIKKFNNFMFDELEREFNSALERVVQNKKTLINIDNCKMLADMQVDGEYFWYISSIDDKFYGYHPTLRMSIKAMLTNYVMKQFMKNKKLKNIIEELKGI